MKKTTLVSMFSALLMLGAASSPAHSENVVIKLGTAAPQGSPWHLRLKEAAQQWKEKSGGTVELRIFPGGTMGDEGDMVKKMRIGTLQAAALSTIGLHDITPEPQALDLPLLVENRAQADCVLQKMAPKLEAALEKKGFVVLTWSDIGFTRFYSTKPRATMKELQGGKLFSWAGDPGSNEAWKAGGFSTVVLSSSDMVPSLQTGMIDTILYPPLIVMSIHADSKTKYMTDKIWSTLTGATIVNKKDWDKVPAALQGPLKQIFQTSGKGISAEAAKMETDSMNKMKAGGVQTVKVTDDAEWKKTVESVYKILAGKVVPKETFDEAIAAAKQCSGLK